MRSGTANVRPKCASIPAPGGAGTAKVIYATPGFRCCTVKTVLLSPTTYLLSATAVRQ